MAQTLDDRIAVPQWSAAGDLFPDQAAWSTFFDAINDSVAVDGQGLAADRPAAGAARTPGVRGGWWHATDTKALSRSDGAAWHGVAALDADALFAARVAINADGVAAATTPYGPFGVNRNTPAGGGSFIGLSDARTAVQWGLGTDATGRFAIGGPTAGGAWATAFGLTLDSLGQIKSRGAASRFGAFANAPAGSAIELGDKGDLSNAYLAVVSDQINAGLILRGQGSTGSVNVQPNGTATALAITQSTMTFTGGAVKISAAGGSARLYLKATDSAVDAKVWDVLPIGNTLLHRAINDAENSATTWLTVTRAGNALSSIAFGTSPAVTIGSTGGMTIGSALALQGTAVGVQTSTGQRMVYRDSGTTYLGEIDGALPTTIRSGGNDRIMLTGDTVTGLTTINGQAKITNGGSGQNNNGLEIYASPSVGWNSLYVHSNWGNGAGGDIIRTANANGDLFKIDNWGRLAWGAATIASITGGTAGGLVGYLQIILNGNPYKLAYYAL